MAAKKDSTAGMDKVPDDLRARFQKNITSTIGAAYGFASGGPNGIGLKGKDLEEVARLLQRALDVVHSADVCWLERPGETMKPGKADPAFERFIQRATGEHRHA